ncbi:protoporphyrinogen oxidase [Halonotius aquaticus]|uniref:Protoporphyrinogen oxidase n=1 Tax=Halonotius aquaticus TaxID=2216978 RepID=A0A3A6QDR1_9EURY|nr:protoporphyrinogen oxidase [Halonotius aquaticus]RJX44190.1 protoporphyrinogen oxidase [Halonotius aquaticus]
MRVGVVGAGISGLTLVDALVDRGVDVVAVESRAEAGGIVRSQRMDGRVVELGPQRLRLTPSIEALVDDLGLREGLRIGDDDQPLYIYHDNALRVAPLSTREAVTTSLLSPLGKLRILAEPLTAPAKPGETVDEFLVRRFGKQAARRYMGPLYSGLYGTDPREMLHEYSLGRALDNAGVGRSLLWWVAKRVVDGREAPPICTFDDGLGTLTDALYEAHSDVIDLDTAAVEIKPHGGGVDSSGEVSSVDNDDPSGFEIVTDAGSEIVDEVVVTTPAPTSAKLVDPLDSDLAATLEEFRYNQITMVFLDSGFDQEGIGALVPPDGELPISGTTWNASFLDRDRLFTCYVDPNSDPELPNRTDEEVGELAADAFEELTGAAATPIGVHTWTPGMPAYDGSWTAMDDLQPPDGLRFCANFVGRPGIPGRIRSAKRIAREIDERE